MKTSKPLRELIPDITRHYQRYRSQLEFDLRLYKMFEGQIRKEVEESLSKEMLSKTAFSRAVQRIPSINIPRKVTQKMSQVYKESPIRLTANKSDQELMESFVRDMYVNSVMNHGNHMTNLHKRSAIEIYMENGKQKSRILPAHQALPYSDSKVSPNEPTVWIKILGMEEKRRDTVTDENGRRTTTEDQITLVEILALYSEDEFMIIDTDGSVRTDKMAEMGATSTVNPFGVMPFIAVNKTPTELIPFPNQSLFDIGVLIPKLLTDLNYSAQFLTHSIVWTKNADLKGAEINPDAYIDLGDDKTEAEGGGSPQLGVTTPETDIEGILALIEFQMSTFLSTEGIKSGSLGQMQGGAEASGISKIMDESDATDIRKTQTELFRIVEHEYWEKFAKIQKVWSAAGVVEEKKVFSDSFVDTLAIKFAEMKPLESDKQKFEKIKIGRDLKLLTKKQALQELFPNLSEEQLQKRLDELSDELSKEKEEMMSMGLTPGFMQLASQQQNVPKEEVEQDAGTESE